MALVLIGTQDRLSDGYYNFYCERGIVDIVATSNSFEVKYPSFFMTMKTNIYGYNDDLVTGEETNYNFWNYNLFTKDIEDTNHLYRSSTSMSDRFQSFTCIWDKTITLNTNTYFNSNNKTINSIDIPLIRLDPSYYGSDGMASHHVWFKGSGWHIKHPSANYTEENGCWLDIGNTPTTLAYIHLTLNAPPVFTCTNVNFTPTIPYNLNTTAQVTFNGLTNAAQYNGYITQVSLQIGEQITTQSFTESNQPNNSITLSINPQYAGNFTPIAKVTDSRGQTTTKILSPITIKSYEPSKVRASVERTNSNGQPEDEGTNAVVIASFNYLNTIVNLQSPIVRIIDANNSTSSATIVWYTTRASDGTLSGTVNWSNVASDQVVYGKISNTLNKNQSFQIVITPRDSQGSGTITTQILAPAFYTIDFLAGGHGIAFGGPASEEGFSCQMPADFEQGATGIIKLIRW